ncbi:MAG: alkaline phosphatase family protein [Candidatus Korobacteraceae bacterium]|jgi:phospholipase C
MTLLADGSLYLRRALALVLAVQLVGCGGTPTPAPSPPPSGGSSTTTPIKHVIIVIGENRSFDNLFATYQPPPDSSQQVWNLLSQQIVTTTGAPGPNFAAAVQHQASDTDIYRLSPPQTGSFATLPQPNTTLNPLLFPPATQYGIASDPGLAPDDQHLLNDGGIFPQFYFVPDNRFPADLPNGPFPITQYLKYSDTMGDPVHRFYQMWQEIDCSAASITSSNPSGCAADLFPWVGTSVGWGLENTPPPLPLTDQSTFQGAVSMGFYNMAAGDVPYFAYLANTYAISDNYHQFLLGGTGPNSISIGTGAPLVYSDANGNPTTPPALQVENPNPYTGSNNWYQQDGFYLPDSGNESNASYTNCSDSTQPGVSAIMNYLAALPYKPFNSGNCAPGAYYLVNNQDPSYNRDGTLRADQSHTVGPSSVPTIGDALSAAGISWKYYGEGFSSSGFGGIYSHYCEICNPFQYAPSIMTTDLKNNLQDITQFYQDVQNGTLPAVSFVKPDDIVDAHPGTSLPELYEAFCRNLVDTVKGQNSLWQQTAIFITLDESGGNYDSGYIQPIDFFGDGPRIPLIAVSPFAKTGYVDHTYGDHASLLKFIEKNWGLKPLSSRSRDNLPNPQSAPNAPYFPTNSPAIGDLMTLFNF